MSKTNKRGNLNFNRNESERLLVTNLPVQETISLPTLEGSGGNVSISRQATRHGKRRRRNRRRERLNTQLLDAVQTDDLEQCQRLIDEGADVNATCRDSGATALMVSSAWGYDKIVSLLLEKGASPLITDNEGRTPIHVAAAQGYTRVLHLLLESKDLDKFIDKEVEIIIKYENREFFDSWIHQHTTLLPNNMPDLNLGSTPLHAASQRSNSECVELLISKGADTEIRDCRGLTPLDVAGEINHLLTFSYGEDINDNDDDYNLHHNDKFTNSEIGRQEKDLDEDDESNNLGKANKFSPSNIRIACSSLLPEGQFHEKLPEKRIRRAFPPSIPGTHNGIFQAQSVGIDFNPDNNKKKSTTKNVIESIINARGKKQHKDSGFNLTKCLKNGVRNGDNSLIKFLLKWQDHIDLHKDDIGPGHLAVQQEDLNILSLLLKMEGMVNSRDNEGRTLLLLAVQKDWMNGVDLLLDNNADIEIADYKNSTVLHVAARKKDSKLLEELLTFDSAEKIINSIDRNEQTPLCCAVEESSIDCVKILLEYGASTMIIQPEELTLLHIAARKGCEEILKLLLTSEAKCLLDYNNSDLQGGMTPLHESCKLGNVNCVKILLENGADIKKRTANKGKPYYGATPLHLAARYDHVDVAEELIKSNDQIIDLRNGDYWEPLHVAARFGKTECVRLLLKSGAHLASVIRINGSYHKTALDLIVNFLPQPVEFFQEIFDSYIYINDYPITHSDCTVTFKYNLLSPSSKTKKHKQLSVLDSVINSPKIILHEVILLHPLVETFLFLKWRKLRIFFFLMCATYCLLTFSTTVLNLSICTNILPYLPHYLHLCRTITITSLIIAATQEVFQVLRLQRYYWTELESWIKWSTFILAGWLALPDFNYHEGKPICYRNISSIAVLISWIELLLLLSRLPNWGFCVLMFCKVAYNVVKVMATFAILFIGFMFSLMITFKSEGQFSNIWESLTKVIVMTSELEYKDMFEAQTEQTIWWSIVARSILLAFVILITIVLMNLMVGIAVNDITQLEAQGKTRRLAKQVSFLSLIEMFVYNDCLLSLFPKCLKKIISKKREVPLNFDIPTGKPHKHNMRILPLSLKNSILDKVYNLKNTQNKNDLKELNNKIDKLIKQQYKTDQESLSNETDSETNSVSSKADKNEITSLLIHLATSLQEVKSELNNLKNSIQSERSRYKGSLKIKRSDAVLKV